MNQYLNSILNFTQTLLPIYQRNVIDSQALRPCIKPSRNKSSTEKIQTNPSTYFTKTPHPKMYLPSLSSADNTVLIHKQEIKRAVSLAAVKRGVNKRDARKFKSTTLEPYRSLSSDSHCIEDVSALNTLRRKQLLHQCSRTN